MPIGVTRVIGYTRAAPPARQARLGVSGTAPVGVGWGGAAALAAAGRIIARQDVTPEMEPDSASLENGEDFDSEENEDVEPDMEPYDATIESALTGTPMALREYRDGVLVQKYDVEVNGDGSVTITPDADEALVVDDLGDEVVIDVVAG